MCQQLPNPLTRHGERHSLLGVSLDQSVYKTADIRKQMAIWLTMTAKDFLICAAT